MLLSKTMEKAVPTNTSQMSWCKHTHVKSHVLKEEALLEERREKPWL